MWYCNDCNSFHVGDCPKTRTQFNFLNSTPKWEPIEPIRPTYEPIIPRYDPLPPPFDPYRFPMPPPLPLPEPPPIIMPPMPDYGPPQSTPEVWQPGYTPYTPNFG